MTDNKGHKLFTKAITGYESEEIHQTIDLPFLLEKYKQFLTPAAVEQLYRELRPPNSKYDKGHRQAFHTIEEVILLGNYLDGNRGAIAGLTHLIADEDKDLKMALKILNAKDTQKIALILNLLK